MDDEVMTLAEVAKALKVAQSTVYAMIKEKDPVKRIPHIRVGKNYRFFASELAKFFNVDVSLIKEKTK